MISKTVRRAALLLFILSCALYSQTAGADLEQLAEQGERALAEQRYGDAEKAYQKLKQLSPETAEVYGRLGLIFFQEGKFEQAVPALRRALKLKPSLPNIDLLLAMSLAELGHYQEALPDLENGFQRSTDLPLKRLSGLQLLRAYTGLGRDSKAMETALELNRLFPNDPEVLFHASKVSANYAYQTLRKLAEVAPSSIWRQQAAAEADESQGNFDLAISEYRQVLAMDPTRRGIHYRIGRVLLARPHTEEADSQAEALKEFQQELQLDSTNANAAYEMGEIYRKSGQLEKAQESFGKALEYYPDFEEAQVGLGGVEIALGKPALAIPHLQQAIALNPADDVSFYRLSLAYKALGKTAEQQRALAEFQRLRRRTDAQRDSLTDRPREVTKQQVEAAGSPP